MLWKDLSVQQIRELSPDSLKEYNKWARNLIVRRIKTYPKQSFQRSVFENEIKFTRFDNDYSKALNYHYLLNKKISTYERYKKGMQNEFNRIQEDKILKRHWGSQLWDEERFIGFIQFMQWARSVYNSSDLDSERLRRFYIYNYEEIDSCLQDSEGRQYLEELIDAEFGFRKR